MNALPKLLYEEILISLQPDIPPDVVGLNRQCLWKERSVHVPNCKPFLVTEAEWKHVRRRSRFQQHRDPDCHQVFFPPARQGAEGNSRHSDRNIRGTCTIVWHRQKTGWPSLNVVIFPPVMLLVRVWSLQLVPFMVRLRLYQHALLSLLCSLRFKKSVQIFVFSRQFHRILQYLIQQFAQSVINK